MFKKMGPPVAAKPDSPKKWLDFMGDTMYIGVFGPRKLAISRSLLDYLEYNI